MQYLETDRSKASKINPSAPNYRHTNPVIAAMEKYLTESEVSNIIHGYIRLDFSEDALITDYKCGDVPNHQIIKDYHYYKALENTKQLFSPPQTYRPASFPDLRYYPWTLPTSAEAPSPTMNIGRTSSKRNMNLDYLRTLKLHFTIYTTKC